MKFSFSKKQTNKSIIESIQTAMGGRSLKDLVQFEETGKDIVVKISKLGTSTLTFHRTEKGDNAVIELASEKIAFAHKAFKDDVKDKLVGVIEKAGGKLIT